MQTWHDGLPSELPVLVALPGRPGMRLRRETAAETKRLRLDFKPAGDAVASREAARSASASSA